MQPREKEPAATRAPAVPTHLNYEIPAARRQWQIKHAIALGFGLLATGMGALFGLAAILGLCGFIDVFADDSLSLDSAPVRLAACAALLLVAGPFCLRVAFRREQTNSAPPSKY
jgi:hypothetical protein